MCTSNCKNEFCPAKTETGQCQSVGFEHPRHISKVIFKPDILATFTAKHKEAIDVSYSFLGKFTKSQRIQVILNSNQPAHALVILAVCILSCYFCRSPTSSPKPYSAATTVVYLLSFALRVGSQFWMTFVSGLTLYFSLKRHAFGDIQRILFPRYFSIMCFFSFVNLISFFLLHSHIDWHSSHWIQASLISTPFILELFARLYVAPEVVRLLDTKREIEITVPGVGDEIGSHKPGPLQDCPHYMSLHAKFRKQHALMAMANIISMTCTVALSFYIASSINFNS